MQIGQKTLLRLSAFNQRTTPELNGVVTRVSPDVTTDQRTGQSYYTIRVSMPPEEIARLGEVKLIPGMPVEAFVQTGDRTMLSYLIKPLSDQLMRAFRGEVRLRLTYHHGHRGLRQVDRGRSIVSISHGPQWESRVDELFPRYRSADDVRAVEALHLGSHLR